jgi:UMF1 family MFS transporter
MQKKMKKEVWAWALYDWANSAFATTIMAGFFPIFFKQFWSAGVDPSLSTARLGLANSFAGLVVALTAPFLGAIADRTSGRKLFLMILAFLGIAGTVGLSLIPEGAWPAASLVYSLALVGFFGGNVFYDSLLKTVATDTEADSVSALGYALGYLGGGVLFSLNVWMTLHPAMFGLKSTADAVRMSFLSVGVWWALFAIPLLVTVKEEKTGRGRHSLRMIGEGLHELKQTFQEARQVKTILLFLAAYWLYIDGVDTIVVMAVDYGLSLGFRQQDLIVALLMTQFIGFPSAIFFGRLAGSLGTKRSILLGIGVYLFVSIWGAFIRTRLEFFLMAGIIGTVQGGVQALSRSFFANLIPREKSAQYFGFYNMIGKFSTIIGPLLIAGTALLSRQLGAGPGLSSRLSILSIVLLFLAGGMMLGMVKDK